MRDNGIAQQTSRRGAGNTATALTSSSELTGKEAPVTIAPQPADENPHQALADAERVATILRLQRTIERLVRQRDGLLAEREELIKRRGHWFVDDGNGYCLACGTPVANRRHVERAA
jgi:hypothetical protein